MANLGLPLQAKAWYFYQTHQTGVPGRGVSLSYTEDVTDGDNTYYISGKIQNMRIGTGDKHEEIWGIDSQCACYLHPLVSDFTFHLEYFIQTSDTLFDRIVDRTARCSFQTTAFCITTNRCLGSGATDKTAYLLDGCKPKTVRLAAAFNGMYLITADFSVRRIITDGMNALWPTGADKAGVGSDPTAFTGAGAAYNAFHVAGSIQKDGADVAHIVDGIDITWEHGLIDKFDHDSMEKQDCTEGQESVTGTVNISLNEGGGFHWAEVLNQGEFQLVIDLGAHAAKRITLPYCRWKSSEIEINIGSEPMSEPAPFTCHPSDSCTDGFVFVVPN